MENAQYLLDLPKQTLYDYARFGIDRSIIDLAVEREDVNLLQSLLDPADHYDKLQAELNWLEFLSSEDANTFIPRR